MMRLAYRIWLGIVFGALALLFTERAAHLATVEVETRRVAL